MMLRLAITKITSILAWIGKHRKLKYFSPTGEIKLNLGCGLSVTKGWINIDGSLNALVANAPPLFLKLVYKLSGCQKYYSYEQYRNLLKDNCFFFYDLSYGIPVESESVTYLYTSHFLEHLSKFNGKKLLSESYRSLKRGGVLRIVIPDLDYALALMNSGEYTRSLDSYFFVDHDGNELSRHKYMYNFVLLENILSEVGFSKIEKCDYQSGVVPDLTVLDNRPDESLYVEAFK